MKAPVLACIYSDSGMGKTAETLFAFPSNACYIAAPGALNCAENLLGVPIPEVGKSAFEAKTLDDAVELINTKLQDKKFVALIVDDLSLLVQNTVIFYETHPDPRKRLKGFDLWHFILNYTVKFAEAVRHSLGAHVILSAHSQPSHDVRGEFIKGGPMLPGKGAAVIPKHCDLVLRAITNQNRLGWPRVFQCNNADDGYTTKDRNMVCADEVPMNLAEILRMSGYVIPRYHGLEWQDATVEKLSEMLKVHVGAAGGVDAMKDILRAAQVTIAKKYTTDPRHIAWTLRDAADRAVLKATRNSPLNSFGL